MKEIIPIGYIPIIPATGETEAGGMGVLAHRGQSSLARPCLKNQSEKRETNFNSLLIIHMSTKLPLQDQGSYAPT